VAAARAGGAPVTGFDHAPTAALETIRGNLLAGLDRIADHLAAGTFEDIAPGRSSPPSQSGHLTLALLAGVDAELERRTTVQEVVICDVDGTVALMGKGEEGRRQFYHWDRVGEDDPNTPVIDLVRILRTAGLRIVFVSGRDEVCRDETMAWLLDHGAALAGDELYMRPHKDNRPDNEVKAEIYGREIAGSFSVKYVVDDRDQVVKMWRSLGLTVLQVADGAF